MRDFGLAIMIASHFLLGYWMVGQFRLHIGRQEVFWSSFVIT